MIRFSILFIAFSSIFTSGIEAEPDKYRAYLKKSDQHNRWFRIGSYQLKNNEKLIDLDLFYSRSHMRPDGKQTKKLSLPTTFNLYCVWQDQSGNWTHKVIANQSNRSGYIKSDFYHINFQQIVSSEQDKIVIELRETKLLRKKNDLTGIKLFQLDLAFVDGIPLTSPTKTKMENKSQ